MPILLGAAMAAALASGQDITAQRVAPRGSYSRSCTEAYTHRGRLRRLSRHAGPHSRHLDRTGPVRRRRDRQYGRPSGLRPRAGGL